MYMVCARLFLEANYAADIIKITLLDLVVCPSWPADSGQRTAVGGNVSAASAPVETRQS